MARSPSARSAAATPKKAGAKPKARTAKGNPRTAKAEPRTAKAEPRTAKAKPRTAKLEPRSPAKPKRTTRAKVSGTARAAPKQTRTSAAQPSAKAGAQRSTPRTRATRPRERATSTKASPEASARSAAAARSPTGAVVQILDADRPVEALRKFLANIPGDISVHQGQIVLGAAQLALLPIAHEHRGGREVHALIDLVLSRWGAFPDRSGFHAQELLRNALAAVGDDRDLVGQLAALVPADASPELHFNLACAHAVTGDRGPMLRAVEAALTAGVSPAQFVRAPDFAAHAGDPELQALLDRVGAPAIPVDLEPHVVPVRVALDSVVKALRELGEIARLEPPATLEAVLAAERARRIQLPNDYRALLTICDGMTLWDHQFFGTLDYRGETPLAKRAREYLELVADATGVHDCVPLASWGQPNDWLVYDPHGRYRAGEPGVVLMHESQYHPLDGLVEALAHFEAMARDVFATN
jgi:hypothetical protein